MPVKKGQKRGPYKKKVETIEPVEVTEPVETAQNDIDIHTQKYEEFLKTSDFNPDEYKEEVFSEPLKTEEVKNETENKEFDFTGQNNNTNSSVNLDGLKNNQKMMINGMLLLSICDMVFPSMLKFIYKYIDTDSQKIDINKVKLDSDQKSALKDVSDYAAAYIFEKVNPLLLFFIGMGGMYYSNFTGELSNVKIKTKVKK